jgi:hypothetical protein
MMNYKSLGETISSSLEVRSKLWPNLKKKGSYAGVDYKLTLCTLQSRLQHIYQDQPYARVDRLYPLARDFGFSLWSPEAGVLDEPYSAVSELGGVAIPARQAT